MENSSRFREAPSIPGDALLLLGLAAALGGAVYFSFRAFPTPERTAVRDLYRAYREGARFQPSSERDRRQYCDLPENSTENLDRKLDHALEETFPTSDPVSVSFTR